MVDGLAELLDLHVRLAELQLVLDEGALTLLADAVLDDLRRQRQLAGDARASAQHLVAADQDVAGFGVGGVEFEGVGRFVAGILEQAQVERTLGVLDGLLDERTAIAWILGALALRILGGEVRRGRRARQWAAFTGVRLDVEDLRGRARTRGQREQ